MTFEPVLLKTPEINVVTTTLITQLLGVMGLRQKKWAARLLTPFLFPLARRMSTLLVDLDRNTAQQGWNSAVKQFLSSFVSTVEISGTENIPQEGPLLVACNHPAAYDIIILAAAIRRDDLKILASDIPLVQKLPNVAAHIIPVPYDIQARLGTVRSAIRHLQRGGAILVFPRGNVEPDPAVSPGAELSLAGWSASLELFLRNVPQTRSVVAIASGILSRRWFKNPLIRMWKKYEQRQKVAEIFQLATQLLTGRKPPSIPKVTLSPPLSVEELGGLEAPQGDLLNALTQQALRLLQDHPHV
jgi:putative hemolysin